MGSEPQIRAALEGLAALYGLDHTQVDQLALILDALLLDELAPTTIKEPGRAIDVHLADSLVALELDVVCRARRIVDIGAGAGFPGLALAVALPRCEMTLVDSQARKCDFIERTLVTAGVRNAGVVCARVEEWPEGLAIHDLALARAVAAQPIVLEYAAPLLRLGGTLVDWRGKRDPQEEDESMEAAGVLGLQRESIRRVRPYDGVRDHHLHVYAKHRETPDRFPRRVGLASKKPLAKRG